MPKKIFIAIIFFVAQFNFCSAQMPESEMSLGGLTFGSSFDYMEKIYGEPNYFYTGGVKKSGAFLYGDSIILHYNAELDRIETIMIDSNNGWKTPAGLSVGMNILDAENFYGKPDYMTVGKNNSAYCYFHTNKNNVHDFGFIILFSNYDGKISELNIRGDTSDRTFEDYYKPHMDEIIIDKGEF